MAKRVAKKLFTTPDRLIVQYLAENTTSSMRLSLCLYHKWTNGEPLLCKLNIFLVACVRWIPQNEKHGHASWRRTLRTLTPDRNSFHDPFPPGLANWCAF